MSKQCTRCKETKPLIEFGKSKQTRDKLTCWCLQCKRDYAKVRRHTPDGIYDSLVGRTNFYKKKPVTISREDFVNWYISADRICVYCDLPEKYLHEVNDPQNDFGSRLTIDCVENHLGYANNNVVLACKRCNNIKNDFFTFDETREICQKYVKPRWEKELGLFL